MTAARIAFCFVALVAACRAHAQAGVAGDPVYVYVNRCASACTIVPGPDDAVIGRSSLVNATRSVGPSTYGNAVFDGVVACMQDLLASFPVEVVTTNPGVPHQQLIVAGLPTQLGFPGGVAGVAPIPSPPAPPNAIGFMFAGLYGANPDPEELCWIAAQQLGVLYRLDIEFHCPDVMSYLATCPVADKTYTPFDAPCGEFMPRTCANGAATQNSHSLMLARTGAARWVLRESFEDPP